MESLTNKDWEEILLKVSETARESAIRHNHPFCYLNEERWIVLEYPDGSIEKLKKV